MELSSHEARLRFNINNVKDVVAITETVIRNTVGGDVR